MRRFLLSRCRSAPFFCLPPLHHLAVRLTSNLPAVVADPSVVLAGVVVPQDAEFEGEERPLHSTQPAPSSVGISSKAGSTAGAPPYIDFRTLRMGVQRRSTAADAEKAEHVSEAFLSFFEHIRFRNGWAQPPFKKEDVAPLFREAADVVVRIRNFLDFNNPSTKLRKVDGDAQSFLHSSDALTLFEANTKLSHRKFVVALVHASFRDAVGYVEGLTKDTVDAYLGEIFEYLYNPRAHALHQVAWLQRTLSSKDMQLTVEEEGDRKVNSLESTTSDYCPTEGEEESWRSIIGKLYDSMNKVQRRLESKKNR